MSLSVVKKSWDTDEFYNRNNNRRPSFLTGLLQRSDESSWNSFLSCKGKPAPVTALPKTFQGLPQDLRMKSRVCASLKGDRAHLCRNNLFLSHRHTRLHHLDPSQDRDPRVFAQACPCLHPPSLLLHSPLYGQVLLLNAPSLSHLCFLPRQHFSTAPLTFGIAAVRGCPVDGRIFSCIDGLYGDSSTHL